MKKYILIIVSLVTLGAVNSCSERELFLTPATSDPIDSVNSEERLQMFLNRAYIEMSSSSAYGTHLMVFGDFLGIKCLQQMLIRSFLLLQAIAITQILMILHFMGSYMMPS